MSTTFFISDTHFGHKNIIKFTDDDGKIIRPFDTVDDMNEHMIECWNKTVSHSDKVIHCGDVAFGQQALALCRRLNGIKYLVLGNHDSMAMNEYAKIFVKIFGVKYIGRDDAICTHIPVSESNFRRFKLNIHGHMHHHKMADNRYVNVSVEQINYTPISLDEIKLRIEQ